MVYIDRNGVVLEKRPWNLDRVKEILKSFWFIVITFLTTLFAPFKTENRGGSRNNRNGGGWGFDDRRGGGGGGGGGGGSSGFRPNRRIGRITNSMDCNIPGGG